MSEQKKKSPAHEESPVKGIDLAPIAVKDNIEGLGELQREFVSGKMVEKKAIALRRKLVELFISGMATTPESALMEVILKRERTKGVITDHDNYLLNQIENDRCADSCVVKTQFPPHVHHMVTGMVCKFSLDADTNKYTVYIPRIVPTEHQMTRELILREQRGHFPAEDEYPKPKTLIHRIIVNEKEFNGWFETLEDDILNKTSSKKEEVYTF